jgi:hypothetical protein
MGKLIFISSPYNNPEPNVMERNFMDVLLFSSYISSQDGVVGFSPIVYGHTLLKVKELPTDWDYWKNFCLTFLDRADELIVYMLPGWEESKGVKEEIEYAKSKNLKITYRVKLL